MTIPICTCNAQLQPHEWLENVCPARWVQEAIESERDATDVYDELWIDHGGEG